MAIPPRTLGRPAPGNTNYQGTGAPDQQLDRDEDRIPAFDPDYDKDDRDKDRGGSATNKNVNTVTGGNVTIGDVGSNNVTRINAKNKAQEFKKKKEAAESEEAKADTDADVSNEIKQEKEDQKPDNPFSGKTNEYGDPIGTGYIGGWPPNHYGDYTGKDGTFTPRSEYNRPSGIPERSVTVRNSDGSKGGFRDYSDIREKKGGYNGPYNQPYPDSPFKMKLFGGSGGYNFNRGGGRTPMRRGAGIRRTGRG